MRYYISEVVSLIKGSLNKAASRTNIIRVDNFPHPAIYLTVAQEIQKWCQDRGIHFVAKLSRGKYEELVQSEQENYHNVLISLEQMDFVDLDDRMTFWRNDVTNHGGVLLMMGTEAVEDRGGLADFFSIDPHVMLQSIGDNYVRWFESCVSVISPEERKSIRKFYSDIFNYVPKDLMKLSSIVEELSDYDFATVDQLLEAMFSNLYLHWQLPNIKDVHVIPSTLDLQKNKGIPAVLRKAVKFIERADFKDNLTPTKYKKYEEQFAEFERKQPDLCVNNELYYPTGSYSDFKAAVLDYIVGLNIEENRKLLCRCDFAVIDRILNIKLPVDRKPKSKPKVHGNPLEALLHSILETIQEFEDRDNIQSVEISISDIKLANCVDEDNEADELHSTWRRFCYFAGGVLDFINAETWLNKQGVEITVGWEGGFDVLSPKNVGEVLQKKIVTAASQNKKLSNALIQVTVSSLSSAHTLEFLWEINPNSHWLSSFALIEDLANEIETCSSYLPFGFHKNVAELVNKTSEEEFLSLLSSTTFDFSANIVDELTRRLPSSENHDLLNKIMVLGEQFNVFCQTVRTRGFLYACSGTEGGAAVTFVHNYTSLLTWTNSNVFTAQVNNVLYLLVNAFLISDCLDNGFRSKGTSVALVPPYHPAMLEKVQAQLQYIRQGALEFYHSVLSGVTVNLDEYMNRLEQLSTITTGVEVVMSKEAKKYSLTKNVFGYYGVYGQGKSGIGALSTGELLNQDLIFDEDFNAKDFIRTTPVSHVVANTIFEYLKTFPAQVDGISVTFVNPNDLQPIVAGLYEVTDRVRAAGIGIKIRLEVLVSSHKTRGTKFLKYWIENFFSEEDEVSIRPYFKVIDLNKTHLEKHIDNVIGHGDIIFFQNVLSTKSVEFTPIAPDIRPADTRFPMVFNPVPLSKTHVQRKTSISQLQFKASIYHSQLVQQLESEELHRLEIEFGKKRVYGVVNDLELTKASQIMIDIAHEKVNWVVCLDTGIDKDLLKLKDNRIISFSTGEGPFGEYNVTISSREEILDDISTRLQHRLRQRFPSWSDEDAKQSSKYCVNMSSTLDGARLLRALNPNDHEVHNFLAYLLTARLLGLNSDQNSNSNYLIRNLIHLDSYPHWFRGKSDDEKRPDFLLFEVSRDSIGTNRVQINATLIECKLGTSNAGFVEKGISQLSNGVTVLSSRWDPSSSSIDKRFWFAQLYRALIFSKINLEDNSHDYESFTQALHGILDGEFKINWNVKLYTFWLDYNDDVLGEAPMDLSCSVNVASSVHQSFGQMFIQKMLLPPELQQRTYEFDDPYTIGAADTSNTQNETFMDDLSDGNTEIQIAEDEYEAIGGRRGEEVRDSESQDPRDSNLDALDIDNNKSSDNTNLETGKASHVTGDANDTQDILDQGSPLESLRILIGEDKRTKEPVYWEYGHPDLPNRHILVSGNSGTGKTYAIQSMVLELSRAGISSIIFDYTDGFTDAKLEPEFREFLGSRVVQFPVYHIPFPINPFKKHEIEIAGFKAPQKDVDVAERITSVMKSVYNLGPQQASAVYQATKNGLQKYKDKMNLQYLKTELELLAAEPAKTTLSKIMSLVDREPFDTVNTKDWGDLRQGDGTVFVVQLSGFTRDIQVLITEFILWDSWYYNVKHGTKDHPFPVILDEAQNLDHSDTSPAAMVLTEGRKFGWSGWFATQFMNEKLKQGGVQRLQQASQKLYFSPPEQDLVETANNIDKAHTKDWQIVLSKLNKGECVVVGYSLVRDKLEKTAPRVVRISSLKERI